MTLNPLNTFTVHNTMRRYHDHEADVLEKKAAKHRAKAAAHLLWILEREESKQRYITQLERELQNAQKSTQKRARKVGMGEPVATSA